MDDKSLSYWQKRVYQLVFLILTLVLLVFMVKVGSFFKELVISFIVAILISYLLGKPVDFITKYIRHRGLSVFVIYATFITAVSWIGSIAFPFIIKQIKSLSAGLPTIQIKFQAAIEAVTNFLAGHQIYLPLEELDADKIFSNIAQTITHLNYTDFGSFVGSFIVDSVTVFVYCILVLIFSFYLLLDGKQIWETLLAILNKSQSEHLREVKKRVDRIMNAYIYGQFQIAVLTTTVMILTYIVLKIPYGFLLGLVQLLEIIPVIGTWVAIVPVIITIAVIKSPGAAVAASIVYLIYTQIIRDYLLAPRIFGHVLGFHPIGVMFAVIIGAKLGGLAGIIIALPIVASINEMFGYFIELSKLRKDSFLA